MDFIYSHIIYDLFCCIYNIRYYFKMKILVCGGRDYNNYSFIKYVLDNINKKLIPHTITCIVHGGARGADSLAGKWAKENNIYCQVYEAEWDKYGKSAGIKRNEKMLKNSDPNLVVAFSGGRGTNHMVEHSLKKNYKVLDLRNIDK